MKLIDALRVAMHNIWQNKSRSVLTIIIVFVVSALIMALCTFGLNISKNQELISRQYFNENGTDIRVATRYESNQNNYKSFYITSEEFKSVERVFLKNTTLIDNVSSMLTASVSFGAKITEVPTDSEDLNGRYITNYTKVKTEMFNFPSSEEKNVKSGRIWSEADVGKPMVWVSENFIKQTQEAENVILEAGDSIVLIFTEYRTGDEKEKFKAIKFTIGGIMLEPDADSMSSMNHYRNEDITIDMNFAATNIGEMQAIQAGYTPPAGEYNFKSMLKQYKAIAKDLNTSLTPSTSNGKGSARITIGIVEDMLMSTIFSIAIISTVLLLSLIIMMLSIGSVANSIIISVDKNKKFIGLMKAMGLKPSGLKSVIQWEAVINILIGVAGATGLIYCLKPVLNMAVSKIMEATFGFMVENLSVVTTISPLVPVITIAAFIMLAFLFSRASVNKIAQADAISIISEVS